MNGTTYKAVISANASPEFGIDTSFYTYDTTPYQIGLIGILMTAIILILLSLIGFWNPAVMFVMQTFAIIITWIVHLHQLNLTSVTSISAILLILAYIVSDRT